MSQQILLLLWLRGRCKFAFTFQSGVAGRVFGGNSDESEIEARPEDRGPEFCRKAERGRGQRNFEMKRRFYLPRQFQSASDSQLAAVRLLPCRSRLTGVDQSSATALSSGFLSSEQVNVSGGQAEVDRSASQPGCSRKTQQQSRDRCSDRSGQDTGTTSHDNNHHHHQQSYYYDDVDGDQLRGASAG